MFLLPRALPRLHLLRLPAPLAVAALVGNIDTPKRFRHVGKAG